MNLIDGKLNVSFLCVAIKLRGNCDRYCTASSSVTPSPDCVFIATVCPVVVWLLAAHSSCLDVFLAISPRVYLAIDLIEEFIKRCHGGFATEKKKKKKSGESSGAVEGRKTLEYSWQTVVN